MHILMALENDFPHDTRVENEIIAFEKAGHKVELMCCTRKEERVGTAMFSKSKIHRFYLPKYVYKLSALQMTIPTYHNYWYRKLFDLMVKSDFDVLHIHDLPLAKTGLKLKKKLGVELTLDYHENRPEIMRSYHHVTTFPGKYLIFPGQWERVQQKITPKADHVILVTDEAKTYYENKYSIAPEKITVIPNYVNIKQMSAFKLDESILEKYSAKQVAFYLGDTGYRRGTFEILNAAKQLPHMHFILIGDSRDHHELVEKKEKEQIDNVELLGYVPFSKAVSYMAASNMGICPFHRNIHHDTTYANKMFQYMYYGLPIVASDCPSQVHVVEGEQVGEVFKAGDVSALVNALQEVLEYTDTESRAERAKSAVLERFNWDAIQHRFNEMYA